MAPKAEVAAMVLSIMKTQTDWPEKVNNYLDHHPEILDADQEKFIREETAHAIRRRERMNR